MIRFLVVLGLIVAIAAGTFLLTGGDTGLRKNIFAQAMPVTYFEPYTSQGSSLDKVAGPVYAFTSGFWFSPEIVNTLLKSHNWLVEVHYGEENSAEVFA